MQKNDVKKIEQAIKRLDSLDVAKKKELLGLLAALKSESVKGFEATHPRLIEILNDICEMLAHLGI